MYFSVEASRKFIACTKKYRQKQPDIWLKIKQMIAAFRNAESIESQYRPEKVCISGNTIWSLRLSLKTRLIFQLKNQKLKLVFVGRHDEAYREAKKISATEKFFNFSFI